MDNGTEQRLINDVGEIKGMLHEHGKRFSEFVDETKEERRLQWQKINVNSERVAILEEAHRAAAKTGGIVGGVVSAVVASVYAGIEWLKGHLK